MNKVYERHFKAFPYGLNINSQDITRELLDLSFPRKENLSSAQVDSLKNIHSDIAILDKALLPFKEAGIAYELGVTGGSIYDFVTNRSELTKDTDVIIHFPMINLIYGFKDSIPFVERKEVDSSHESYISFHNLYSSVFRDESRATYTDAHVFKLVSHFIKKELSVDAVYNQEDLKGKNYIHDSLFNLMKISDSKLSKPMDLMFSNHKIIHFIHSFDFYICRMLYQHSYVKEDSYAYENKREFSVEKMLDNLFIATSALFDLRDKKITMNMRSFKDESVEFFMEHHFPRLKMKLPEYSLQFQHAEVKKELADYYLLKNALPIQNENENINKRLKI